MSKFDFLGSFLGKKANLSRDGHDMSRDVAYSSPFATINVVDKIDVVPNEHYRCKYDGYVQTAPMREDNFATIYNNMKAVFVPYSSLSRNYIKQLLPDGKDTRINSLYKDLTGRDFRVSLSDLFFYLFPSYFFAKFTEALLAIPNSQDYYCVVQPSGIEFKRDVFEDGRIRVYDMSEDESLRNNPAVTILLNRCSFTQGAFVTSGMTFPAFLEKISSLHRSVSGNAICYDAMRLLDNLGYINLYPVMERHLRAYINYVLIGQNVPEIVITSIQSHETLVLLDFVTNIYMSDGVSFPDNETISLRPLFAYYYYLQMCESANYRKPTNLEVFTMDSLETVFLSHDIFVDDVCFFDLSDLSESYNFVFADHETLPDSRFDLAFSYPHTISECGFYAGNSSDRIFGTLFTQWNPLLYADMFTTMQTEVVSGSIPTLDSTEMTINPLKELNELGALYKYREDLLRAGVRRDQVFKSIFGVSPEINVTDDIMILDETQNRLNITGLINQAETEVAPLGSRAARGNGANGLEFSFDSKDYGVLLIVQYFTTEMFYEQFAPEKTNKINFSSFWNPKFNNLGLESVDKGNISLYFAPTDGDVFVLSGDTSEIVGFSSRYWEYKQRVNVVHGMFTNFGFNTSAFALPAYRVDSRYQPKSLMRGNSVYGGFLPTLIDQQTGFFNDTSKLRFNPFMLNGIFTTLYDGAAYGSAIYDHFRCIMRCQVHKVSPMPKVGLLRTI